MQNFVWEWINKFYMNFFSEDSDKVLSLLEPQEKQSFEYNFKNIFNREQIFKIINDNVRIKIKDESQIKLWTEFFLNHHLYKINKYRENFLKSFEFLKDCFNNLIEIHKLYQTPRFLSYVMKYYMRNLLFISNLADMELEQKKEKTFAIDECGRILIGFFSKFQMSDDKWSVFFCIICLIRIYFKMKTYRNSKTLVEWVDKSGLNLDNLPKAEVTTFFYYSGRLSLYELKIAEAHKILSNAFHICKSNHFTNRKLLLEYLIVLNLFYGITPREELLEKYELMDYNKLVIAYKQGNLTEFENAIEVLEDRLITLGTFLIIEKLKCYVMRNFIRNVHKHYFSSSTEGTTNVPIIKIQLLFDLLKNVSKFEQYTFEELELYIIGVIYKGLISGYVHNVNKVIVFSKKAPFPKLGDVFKKNYEKII
jgi:hypothetical protein